MCIGGIQLSTAGDAFSAVDPSMLKLYYPMDDVSGTGRLYNYATGTAVTDASLYVYMCVLFYVVTFCFGIFLLIKVIQRGKGEKRGGGEK